MMFETEKPRRKPGSMCPQFRQDVSEVCHNCEWYQNLKGKHPQTGEEIDRWGCSVAFSALVGVGVIQAVNNNVGGLQSATESFRNEVAKSSRRQTAALAALLQPHVLREHPHRLEGIPVNGAYLTGPSDDGS